MALIFKTFLCGNQLGLSNHGLIVNHIQQPQLSSKRKQAEINELKEPKVSKEQFKLTDMCNGNEESNLDSTMDATY